MVTRGLGPSGTPHGGLQKATGAVQHLGGAAGSVLVGLQLCTGTLSFLRAACLSTYSGFHDPRENRVRRPLPELTPGHTQGVSASRNGWAGSAHLTISKLIGTIARIHQLSVEPAWLLRAGLDDNVSSCLDRGPATPITHVSRHPGLEVRQQEMVFGAIHGAVQ